MDSNTRAEFTNLSAGAAEEAYLAFQNMTPDGFMMFQPVRDENGVIVDLEWVFVNTAASVIVDRKPEELIGRRLLVEMPGNKDEGLFDAYVNVLETGRIWQNEFHYDHGGIRGWFRATAAKSGDWLAISFADITEIRKGDERLRSLIDGVLAFVGVLSVDGTLLMANEPAVAASGLKRDELVGLPFWECYWWGSDQQTKDKLQQAVARAASGEQIRYDAEIRIAGDQRMWIDFQISPVFGPDGEVIELIPSGVDITERKQSEAHREFLIRELSHRVKNTLATIQSLAGQTSRASSSWSEFRASFNDRLKSIAASHDLLVKFQHEQIPLRALIEGQVLSYAAGEDRLKLVGEDVLLPGDSAHFLGLILHELATNAAKYGAFSTDTGTVSINWHLSKSDTGDLLVVRWQERGGPLVEHPTRRGFGTHLIERSLSGENNGAQISYEAEGLTCTLKMTLR